MTKGLDRYLSQTDVWGMAFGCMVGWGAFVMPGTTFLPTAGPLGSTIALVLGTIVMLIIAAGISFLMMRSPRTGGIYNYVKEAFGRDHAFLCSWFLCLSYLTIVFLNGTALFIIVRMIFGEPPHSGFYYTVAGNRIYIGEVAVSILTLAVTGIVFIFAKPFLQQVHRILAITMFVGVVALSVICLPHSLQSGAVTSYGIMGINKAYSVLSLVVLAPWAFVGFEVVTFDTAHFKFPLKKTRGIVLLSILMAAFAYITMNLSSLSILPPGFSSWEQYVEGIGGLSGIESVPVFYAANEYLGTFGLVIAAVTAFSAIMTGIIGAYRAMVRVLSTMAEDRILSERFSKTSYSIKFITAISILISLVGRNTLVWYVDLTLFGAIVAYGYTSAAAVKVARAENNRRIEAVGILGLIISLIFIIVELVPNVSALETMGSEAFLLLSLWCLLGFVFYWRTVNESSLAQFSGLSTSGIALFSLLLYSALMWLGKLLMRKESVEEFRALIVRGGVVLLLIIFVGLMVMLYLQELVREKHAAIEREKIRAVEGSLAKSQFLFNMSHDIRTPMNAIIGYTNLAMKEPSSPQQEEYLSKIETSSRQLLSLINDILEMSRIESGKVELEYAPADLRTLFDEMEDLFGEQMKAKGIEFSVHTAQVRNNIVWCDRKNLNRVLLNLLSNAYKFTMEGGSVSAILQETGNDEYGYGSYEIHIRDSGIGMSADFVEKMFNAFERERTSTNSGLEGTGLGLAITKNLVDLMGGTIEVLTSPGSGTEIIVRLKFQLASEEELLALRNTVEEEQEPVFDYSKMRVLLVEDNDINREIANLILTEAGFTVESAENGQIAVDMVEEADEGYYDLVLMDIQMPVMDGYTATRTIRALSDREKAGIPIIAMTANAFKEDEEAAMESGMQAHIAKPVDVEIMMKTINKVLQDQHRQ